MSLEAIDNLQPFSVRMALAADFRCLRLSKLLALF
jgi:hypothetical protein